MSRPKLGGPHYVPAAPGGRLVDRRSIGASQPAPQRPLLSDPRSSR